MSSEEGWTKVTYKKEKAPKPPVIRRISASHLETEEIKKKGYEEGEASPRFAHQDWKPQVVRSKSIPVVTKVEAKPKKSASTTIVPVKKLENEESEESMKIPKVNKETGVNIQKGRLEKKLTQEQLAQHFAGRYGITKEVIRDIENGTAVYNGMQIAKIKEFLGI